MESRRWVGFLVSLRAKAYLRRATLVGAAKCNSAYILGKPEHCHMTTSQPSADLLFGSEVLPLLLQAVLTAPDKRFGWTDLNRALAGANRESLYRALGRALELGVVKREPKGRYGIYSANTDSPIYKDLRRLLAKLEIRRHNLGYSAETIADLARDLRRLHIKDATGLPNDALALILQFVDDFRSRRRNVQRDLLIRRPTLTGNGVVDAYLAGLAEYLSNEAGLPAPAWVEDPDRFLRQWWIESDVPSAGPTAFAQSPAAFRRRGIFISERALELA